jgi:hypothetical protein
MKIMFGLLFYLLLSPLVFAHENAAPEIDRKFLDNLQRPDNRPDDRRDKKSKSCCTDKDAVKVEYKLVVPDALCIRSLSGTCWIESYKPDGTPGEYKWVKVPSEKIVVEYSPSGQAYVYVIGRNIQCFVRPQTRY